MAWILFRIRLVRDAAASLGLTLPQRFYGQATTLDTCGCRDGGAFGSLHIVLGSSSAGFRIFLVEGDAFGFAHEGELYVDVVEEFGTQEGGVGCTGCDREEFWPVLGDECGVVHAKAWIEERAGVEEIEEALLFGAHRPRIFFEPFEEAEGFVFIVELVGDCGDGGSAKKIYGFIEAGFQGAFDVLARVTRFRRAATSARERRRLLIRKVRVSVLGFSTFLTLDCFWGCMGGYFGFVLQVKCNTIFTVLKFMDDRKGRGCGLKDPNFRCGTWKVSESFTAFRMTRVDQVGFGEVTRTHHGN
jgi:hypothetical protein